MAIATRDDIFKNIARGKGVLNLGRTIGHSASTTAAAAASGFLSVGINWNLQGTAVPSTPVTFGNPPATDELLLMQHGQYAGSGSRAGYLALIYRFGTLALNATGDQFTHDSTFTSLHRTRYGMTEDVELVPIVYITTATTTSAPVFRLRTVAGGAGYTNQVSGAKVGTKTMTMPAAATTINSAFVIRLEDGDTSVRNISNIEVTNAGNAGAAIVVGAELLCPIQQFSGELGYKDNLFGGLSLPDLMPAVPDAGEVIAWLGIVEFLSVGAQSSGIAHHYLGALAV